MDEAAERTRGPMCRFGPFVLDCRNLILTRGSSQVRLPHSLMRLLICFVERRGELVTRKEIEELLWDQPQLVDVESGINTAVNRLRAALGETRGAPRYLETVVGVGYRCIATVEWLDRGLAAEVGRSAEVPETPDGQAEATASARPPVGEVPDSEPVKRGGVEPSTECAESSQVGIAAAATRTPPRALVWSLVGLCLLAVGASLVVRRRPPRDEVTRGELLGPIVQATYNDSLHPVTTLSISPDGRLLAFSDQKCLPVTFSHSDCLTVRHLDQNADESIPFPKSLRIKRIAWFSHTPALLVTTETEGGGFPRTRLHNPARTGLQSRAPWPVIRPLYPIRSSALRIVLLLIGFRPSRPPGKSSSPHPVRLCKSCSTSSACRDRGTVCGVRIFIRSFGTS